MPTYEYKCEACGHHEEVFAKMSDPPPAACEACGAAELVKVLFPVAVHYKGSGFYKTDYEGTKGKPATASTGDGASASSSSDSSSGSTSDSASSASTGSSGSGSASSTSGSTGSSND